MTSNNSICPLCSLNKLKNEFTHFKCCGNAVCIECLPHVTCPLCTMQNRDNFEFSAANGHAEYELANRYESGIEYELSHTKAHFWYHKAADKGYTAAEYSLGAQYLAAKGVEQDLVLAEKWLKKAAEKGHARAQFELGRMYKEGASVQAVEWIRASAEQQYDAAECELGYLYQHGELGVGIDVDEAVKWYERAAFQGNEAAFFNLGELYFDKEEIPIALFWLRKVSTSEANAILKQIENSLQRTCVTCGAERLVEGKLLCCSQCQTYYYCDRKCQKKHWKDVHKIECNHVAKLSTAYLAGKK